MQDQVLADGIEFFTPYAGFTVTAARAENFLSAWGYSLFGTGNFFFLYTSFLLLLSLLLFYFNYSLSSGMRRNVFLFIRFGTRQIGLEKELGFITRFGLVFGA